MRHFLSLMLIFSLAACSTFADDENNTPTPRRFETYEAIHVTQSGGLTVTLQELTLLETDVQILAVLADGQGQLAYALYPSNQPGISDTGLSLADYPLTIETTSGSIGLWVLAVRHMAYPVAERIGMDDLAAELATAFNRVYAQSLPARSPAATVVASADRALLDWFGEVEIVGEVALALTLPQDIGEHTIESPDKGFRLRYTVSAGEIAAASTPTVTSLFPEAYPGYRKVVDENFTDNDSEITWFQARDELYTVLFNDETYEVALLELDPESDTVISWGSIQEMVFDDYIVRAKIRMLEPGTFGSTGLWLDYQDAFNFMSFAVNHIGEYRIMRFQRTDTELVDWTRDEAVNRSGQINVIEVRLTGNQYTLSINGKELATVTDDEFENGRIAFYCYAEEVPLTCQLDEIQIWIPENAPFPSATSEE